MNLKKEVSTIEGSNNDTWLYKLYFEVNFRGNFKRTIWQWCCLSFNFHDNPHVRASLGNSTMDSAKQQPSQISAYTASFSDQDLGQRSAVTHGKYSSTGFRSEAEKITKGVVMRTTKRQRKAQVKQRIFQMAHFHSLYKTPAVMSAGVPI